VNVKSLTKMTSNNFMQTGDGHCLSCHKDTVDSKYCPCTPKSVSACTKSCGKWYKEPIAPTFTPDCLRNLLPEFIDEQYEKGVNKDRGKATVAITLFTIWLEKRNKPKTL
jgi:hypothetical protein